MKKKNTVSLFLGVCILLCSLSLTVGVRTLFHACVHDDGAFGACHWAQQAIFGAGIVLSVLSLVRLLFPGNGVKLGLDLGIIVNALLAALTPGILIHLCMMDTMVCNALMRPIVCAIAAVIAILALIDTIILGKSAKEGKSA
ncbi:MAG: DUF4418 family protein [Clostridia bacterium]|nr:DUF4418 family protein [Clostridia bacterium]